jgi:hypothetical protein
MIKIVRFIFLCIQLIAILFMGMVIFELITNNTMTDRLLVRLVLMFGIWFMMWLLASILKRGITVNSNFLDQ